MLINFFPLKFDFEEYEINCVDYSEEYFKHLRSEYNSTHSFFNIGQKSTSQIKMVQNLI